jgi:hypothetical protein
MSMTNADLALFVRDVDPFVAQACAKNGEGSGVIAPNPSLNISAGL